MTLQASFSSVMSQNQWVKCLCQVAEIVAVCPIKFNAEYNDIAKTQGGPIAALIPFSQGKMYFISKRIWCKEALKNIYYLLANHSMRQN